MRIGVLGTDTVGQTLGSKLVQEGHDVRLGARSAGNAKAEKWTQAAGGHASHGTFGDAASFGAVLFNCTVAAPGRDALSGTIPSIRRERARSDRRPAVAGADRVDRSRKRAIPIRVAFFRRRREQ